MVDRKVFDDDDDSNENDQLKGVVKGERWMQ